MAAHRKSDQNRDDLRGGVLRKRVRVQKSPITSGATLTAQQAKELKALTATLKEQASQIQKVSDRLEHLKPTKKDLMISRIISRRSVSGGTYFQPQIVLQLSLPSW